MLVVVHACFCQEKQIQRSANVGSERYVLGRKAAQWLPMLRVCASHEYISELLWQFSSLFVASHCGCEADVATS